jgi:acetyl-CoA carboxylase carboxyltransferase component
MSTAVFRTSIDKSSEVYKANRTENVKLAKELQSRVLKANSEGKPGDMARHVKRGQLLGRERVYSLLDEGSPFLELWTFAGFGNKDTPRTGLAGIGLVCGREVLILADLPTVRGGAKNEMSVVGGVRALNLSIENRLPVINLIQTAGADLTQQHKVFHRGGETFRLLAHRAKLGLPTISVVFGSSTAGGAYHPGMSDYVVMVKEHAKVYLGGPPLVKMATGDIVTHEELGGAAMHSTVSGVSDFLAFTEHNGIRIAREIVSGLTCLAEKCVPRPALTGDFEEPFYPAEELLGIVSPTVKQPFDMAEVIARICDGSRIVFFKSNFGKTLVCAWCSIAGFPVGIIANNGVLFSDSAQKGTQFIHLCNQKNVPILFFHNITGFMVGRQSEQGGLIKHGSLMVNAVSNSKVPHISIIMGASFGAGNYAMCGRAYAPRFLFSYPSAKCSVMGSEQLSGVMDQVAKERIAKQFGADPPAELIEAAEKQRQQYQAAVEKQMDAYFTSALLLDDNIIDPRDTRTVLSICLSVVHNAPVVGGNLAGVSRL